MAIKHIHSYLVHSGKGNPNPPLIKGADVPLGGSIYDLLSEIYLKSDAECDIQIRFKRAEDGTQQNDCRDLLLAYLANPSLSEGLAIAKRLQINTDRRSKDGLFFIIHGTEGATKKIVISRFPTDKAILAEETKSGLTVEYLEKVFMKSQTSYKAAAYQHASMKTGFWAGRAADKQINSRILEASNYWIFDFLASDFRVTAAAGTRQLGSALRAAAKSAADIAVRTEIAAAVTLAGNMQNQKTTIRDFIEGMRLSPEAQEVVIGQLPDPKLADVRFQFDAEEFKSQVGYRAIGLNNGAMLLAETSEFDEVFEQEVINDDEIRFSTQGRVVSDRLRKAGGPL